LHGGRAAHAWGARSAVHWLRAYNAGAEHPVHLLGIDVSESGGTLLPALTPVAGYLNEVDREVGDEVAAVIRLAERLAAGSALAAVFAWSALGVAGQDELTARLTRLSLRFEAPRPLYVERGDEDSYERMLRHLRAPSVETTPMGLHLREALGEDYVAIALTTTATEIPDMEPDPGRAVGFRVVVKEAGAPLPGSVEAALVDSGHGDRITLTPLRGTDSFERIRTQGAYMETPLADPFDAVISLPRASLDAELGI
jgi:erythromycin esterase-like protein